MMTDAEEQVAESAAKVLESVTLDGLIDEFGFHTQAKNKVWMETYDDNSGDVLHQYELTITARFIN